MEENQLSGNPKSDAPKKNILIAILVIIVLVVGGGLIYKFTENTKLEEEMRSRIKSWIRLITVWILLVGN